MILCTTYVSLHPCTLESSYKVVDVNEPQSSLTFLGVDVVFTHPVSVCFTQDVFVERVKSDP